MARVNDQPEQDAPRGAPDAGRLERLYRDQASRLRRRLAARLASREEAHDLVQDAFAHLVGSGALRRLRTPEAFLGRIVRNLLIDRERQRLSRGVHVAIDEGIADAEAGLAIPPAQHDELELAQMRQRYQAAVATLPPRMREVFLLHRVEDVAYKEIAARLDISIRTVEWHVAEAVVRIARLLEDE